MEVSENAPGGAASVHMAALNADAREFSRILYHVMVSTVQGKGLSVIRGGERANGLQCWGMLCEELEPKSGSRFTAFLCGLLAPPWTGLEGLHSFEPWLRGRSRLAATKARAGKRSTTESRGLR